MSEATGRALVEHWNWAADKGLMNKNTAAGLRAACTQVLGALENWQDVDIKALDLDDTFMRFQTLRKKQFKPTVLATYRHRFRKAVESYLNYLEDPGGWRPHVMERSITGTDKNAAERSSRAERAADAGRLSPREMPQANMVDYPFPVREGQIARLVLPRDLKASEVKRLHAFMAALVADDSGAS
jgi:hypothetical protein